MDDFLQRLREAVDSEHFYAESSLYFDEKLAHTVDEAADRIERLTRERDEALALLRNVRPMVASYIYSDAAEAVARIDALLARREG